MIPINGFIDSRAFKIVPNPFLPLMPLLVAAIFLSTFVFRFCYTFSVARPIDIPLSQLIDPNSSISYHASSHSKLMAHLLDSDPITMDKTGGSGLQGPDPSPPTQNVSTRKTRATTKKKATADTSTKMMNWLKPDEEDMVPTQVDANPESAIKFMLEERNPAKRQRISTNRKAYASGLDESISDGDEPPPVSGDNPSDSDEDDDNVDMFEDVLAIEKKKNVAPRKKGIYHDSYKIASGIDGNIKPIAEVTDMFGDMVGKALKSNQPIGLEACAKSMGKRPIRMGTMCSGTESPVLSAEMIRKELQKADPELEIVFEHIFSAEIVPYKQHYIQTNFEPPVLFADITELTKDIPQGQDISSRTATTAYGGQAHVPGGLDLLIAGFSCVDFSNLNGLRKDLEQRGESGDTFFAIREYAKHYRPRVIILENVVSAPWFHSKIEQLAESERQKAAKLGRTPSAKIMKKNGLDRLMSQVGYATRCAKLDTKEFYLPQTRERGYMVCVDRVPYLEEGVNIATKLDGWWNTPKVDPEDEPEGIVDDLDEWEKLVSDLKRPASVPAEFMLLRSDDPILELFSASNDYVSNKAVKTTTKGKGKGQGNGQGKTKASTPWIKAKIGHHDYRNDLLLGSRRELTGWQEGGTFTPEDFWMRSRKGLVERVLDTIEIAHLRNLKRGFDDRYYYRLLELSQNAYRVTDTTKNGIVGCLTPNGMPFLTTRGGRVIGLEALSLQGLPLSDLELNMLSQANLQDLAGNAMSATVVGATMIAAISIFFKKFILEGKVAKPRLVIKKFHLPGEEFLLEKNAEIACPIERISVESAMHMASLTCRLCKCEGRLLKKVKQFQRCTICGHTTCKQCGVKPLHHFVPIPETDINLRKEPSEFEALFNSSALTSISFGLNREEISKRLGKMFQKYGSDIDPAIWGNEDTSKNSICYMATVTKAFASTVSLRDIRRDEFWEITWDSPDAKLILIASKNSVKWLLYANVVKEGIETPRGKYFRQWPIACMLPEKKSFTVGSSQEDISDITIGEWKLWLPKTKKFEVSVESSGTKVKSFAHQRGLVEMQDDYVFPEVKVKFTEEVDQMRYFGRAIDGTYVLSQECGQPHNSLHALENPGKKPLFLYLEQHMRTGLPKLEDNSAHYFVFTEERHRLEKLESRCVLANLTKSWRQPTLKLWRAEVETWEQANQHAHIKEVDGSQAVRNLNQPANLKQTKEVNVEGRWEAFPFIKLARGDGSRRYYHLPQVVAQLKPNSSCEDSTIAAFKMKAALLNEIDLTWSRDVWTRIKKANESRLRNELGWLFVQGGVMPGHIHLAENWSEIPGPHVTICQKCSPEPPRLLWTKKKTRWNSKKALPCEDPKDATDFERLLKARPVPFTAMLKVTCENEIRFKIGISPLTLAHRARALLGSHDPVTPVQDITASWRLVTDDHPSVMPSLRPFEIINTTTVQGSVELPGFKKTLRPEQMRALVWLLERDTSTKYFFEEEVVEARLAHLRYRLEGKATRGVLRNGGLLFFDVGFGKTAISLALMSRQLTADTTNTQNLMKKMPLSHGRIPIKATIIFVPGHLPKQWEEEVESFLGKTKLKAADLKKTPGQYSKVLVIDKIPDLIKSTVGDFMEAEIIIVSWQIVIHTNYQLALAQFTGLVERDDNGTLRSQEVWYHKAASLVPDTVKKLYQHQNGGNFGEVWDELYQKFQDDQDRVTQCNAYMPTKRTRGKKYVPVSNRLQAQQPVDPSIAPIASIPAARPHDAEPKGKKHSRDETSGADAEPEPKRVRKATDAAARDKRNRGEDDDFEFQEDIEMSAPLDNDPEFDAAPKKRNRGDDDDFEFQEDIEMSAPFDDDSDFDPASKKTVKPKKTAKPRKTAKPKKTVKPKEIAKPKKPRKAKKAAEGEATAEAYAIENENANDPLAESSEEELEALDLRDGTLFNLGGIDSPTEMTCALFEMFHFARILVDEYPYAPPLAKLIMDGLHASSRYGLSGTPSLSNFDDVREMGALLNVKVGSKDYSSLRPAELTLQREEMTRCEKFLSYGERKSGAWHDSRHEQAREFLNFFGRKDAPDLSLIKCIFHYCLVDLAPAHKGGYLELQQRVSASNFENLQGSNVASDIEMQIRDAVLGCNDEREALLVRASMPLINSDGSTSTEGVVKTRQAQYHAFTAEIGPLMKKAYWLSKQKEAENCSSWVKLVERITSNTYNDEECRDELKELIGKAIDQYDIEQWKDFYYKTAKQPAEKPWLEPFPQGMNVNTNTSHLTRTEAQCRQCCSKLSRLAERLVNHKRCLRFMEEILSIQENSSICSICQKKFTNAKHITLLACGHVGCRTCLPKTCETCPVSGCEATIKPHTRVKGEELYLGDNHDESFYGRKIDEIIALINNVSAKQEKVLLFAQFPSLINALRKAMDDKKIQYIDLTIEKDQSKNLVAFQKPDCQEIVLLINPIKSSAAGANLTAANHVVFSHTLHTTGFSGQSDWKNIMTQAIGRARRYGQTKPVNVYMFMATRTIDIDSFEHRTGFFVRRQARDPSRGKLESQLSSDAESTLQSGIAQTLYPYGRETDALVVL